MLIMEEDANEWMNDGDDGMNIHPKQMTPIKNVTAFVLLDICLQNYRC